MKIIVFDLDGTLAESKSSIDSRMASCLKKLLKKYKVAVISGGAWPQFETQLIGRLSLSKVEKKNLFLLPTSGTTFYSFVDNSWRKVYSDDLTSSELEKIFGAFSQLLALPNVGLPDKTWGERLENRGTQVTFSAMGQEAPVEEKKSWDPKFTKRLGLVEKLAPMLPEFEIRTGGSTSIDVTRKGIDKAYGIKNLEKILGISREEFVFVGDALFPGGNDRAVYESGVECVETTGPSFTLTIIKNFLKR